MAGVLSTFVKSTRDSLQNQVTRNVAARQLSPLTIRFKSESQPIDDYQFMTKSEVPTLHFQKSLPRLPIPNLQKTCEKYLRAQKPLLDTTAYDRTKSYVNQFLKDEGIRCQKALIKLDKKKKHTSYITQPWFDMYFLDRRPLPINFNPFLVFKNNPEAQYNNQLIKASNLLVSSLRFYRSLNEGVLEPEVFHLNPAKSDTAMFRKFTSMLPSSISWYGAYLFKAYPLDMSQYPNLFNTARFCLPGMDMIKHFPGSKHILVMKGGHFYVFDVIDENDNIVSPELIASSLDEIMNRNDGVAEHPVGVLTTADRNHWCGSRGYLDATGNADVLNIIDSSLFCLALDDTVLGDDPVKLVRSFLHSDGTNRWFDKSFSLIISKDGTAGINFEHSWGDGVAVLRYFNDVHKDSTVKPRVHPDTSTRSAFTKVKKLEFILDDKMKNLILETKSAYDATCKSLDVHVLDYIKFGRQLCRPLNVSPDAVMQLAFQMAYDNITGRQAATYESCSTAAFKHGRTETVRPCTVETQKFCKELRQSSPPSKTEVQKMIVECSKVHSNLIKEAAMGQGFDRHLFALRLRAEAQGLKPAIFTDPAYAAINHNILSTSTLSSENLLMGAFGPVVPDGFGIGYSVWPNRLGTIVTNYKGKADGSGFIRALEYSFDRIHQYLSS